MDTLGFKIPLFAGVDAVAVAAPGQASITTTEFDVEYSNASAIELEATGGTGPYTYALDAGSPPLPTGCTLNADGTITGNFEVVGTFSPIVIATPTAGDPSDPTEITIDVALPAALSGAILILRAAAYDDTTGNWASDISPSTLIFEQATESARPAEGSDAQGAEVVFGGDDYLIANAAVRGLQVGLNDMSGIWVAEGFTDNIQYIQASASSAQSGLNCNCHTSGAGSVRLFTYLTGTFYQATNAGTPSVTTRASGLTHKRNTANQPVGYVGSTTYTGASTIKDEAFGATNQIAVGGSWDGTTAAFFFTGSIRTIINFNKALSAAEMQAAQEYLQNKSFFGTSGISLWA